jgi:hypothetical protein
MEFVWLAIKESPVVSKGVSSSVYRVVGLHSRVGKERRVQTPAGGLFISILGCVSE